MARSRLLTSAVVALLLLGAPLSAPASPATALQEPAGDEPQEDAAPEGDAEAEAGGETEDPDSGQKAERKAKRKAKRERQGGEEEAAPATAVEPEDDTEPDAESDQEPDPESDSNPESDADSDSEADLPGLLIFETDAESDVFVRGVLEGRVEPGEKLEVPVELGEIPIRATAIELATAIWEKTIELEEPGTERIRIRMLRTIRAKRREERATSIFRDPKSHLMWPKRDNGLNVDLRRAYAYCRDLETGGFDDWRLPTLAELESLQAIWERGAFKILGGILLTECCMWSSEYDGSERAWTFNFRFRKAFQTNAGYELGLRALCVREWDPEAEEGEPEEPEGSDGDGGT